MELFSFQDLMSFGMFIIALLTFIVLNTKKQLLHRKSALTLWPSDRAEFPSLPIGQPTLWAVVLFHFQYTTIYTFVQQQKVIRAQKIHPQTLATKRVEFLPYLQANPPCGRLSLFIFSIPPFTLLCNTKNSLQCYSKTCYCTQKQGHRSDPVECVPIWNCLQDLNSKVKYRSAYSH